MHVNMNAIECTDVFKKFGEKIAVNSLNMTVNSGKIYGFLGPNGAGKTTTLKMLAGLAKPTSGTINIFGEEIIFGKQYSHLIGYVHDCPEFPQNMNARSFLIFMGELCGFRGQKLKSKVDEVLQLVGLYNEKSRAGGFSRGMKQRLGVAQALLGSPKVVILDEPSAALDPIGRKDIFDLILSVSKNTTVLFSTHILEDADRICDTIGIINKGKMIVEAEKEELRKKFSIKKLLLEFDSVPETLIGLIREELPDCQISVDQNRLILKGNEQDVMCIKVQRMLANESAIIRRLEIIEPSLEDIFVKLVNNNG